MGNQRRGWGEGNPKVYTVSQIEGIVDYLGIEVSYQSESHIIGFCPFHQNDYTPAWEIDKSTGQWICFNPGCGVHGELFELTFKLKQLNPFQTARLVLKFKDSRTDRKAREAVENFEFAEMDSEPVERMYNTFWDRMDGLKARFYMEGRGFTSDTLIHFTVGWSDKQQMVIVPVHSPDGLLIGFVGRSIVGKQFKNSKGLPKSRAPFNFHRARKHGDTVIIVESIYDAMRIHQAGYPNVIALLGGSLSKYHIELINKTFSKIIIMTDFDWRQKDPCGQCRVNGFMMCQGHRDGRDLGRKIVESFPTKRVFWAAYDDTCVYPHDAKDASDMEDAEIVTTLRNAISNFSYVRWDIESRKLALA